MTGVVLALFTSLETSIYTTIALSFALLLVRLARTKGRFLGLTKVYRLRLEVVKETSTRSSDNPEEEQIISSHDGYLPIDRNDASNPNIEVKSPYPGVFIYRFTEGFNYINQGHHIETLQKHILRSTRPTKSDDGINPRDRLWNDPGPSAYVEGDDKLPIMRAVVLDCSAVNNMDISSIQGLIDIRNTLDRYAAPAMVEWHFAGITNRWTRRALATVGFGYHASRNPEELGRWSAAYTVAKSFAGATEEDRRHARELAAALQARDEETSTKHSSGSNDDEDSDEIKTNEMLDTISVVAKGESSGSRTVTPPKLETVYGINRPLFHLDLHDAVDQAVMEAKKKDVGREA